jgi:hypothetical protein
LGLDKNLKIHREIEMSEIILQWWPIVLGAIAFTAWLLRLEATVKRNTDEIKSIESRIAAQRIEDSSELDRKFDAVNLSLAVIQSDIKELLKNNVQKQDG